MFTYTLTPTNAPDAPDWLSESNALTQDSGNGLWATNGVNNNGWLVLNTLSGVPTNGPGQNLIPIGFEIYFKPGIKSADGSHDSLITPDDFQRVYAALSKNGSTPGDLFLATCDAVSHVVGDQNNTMSLGATLADLQSSNFAIIFRRPTELAFEDPAALRSIEYSYIKAYMVDLNDKPVITSSDGSCDGTVDITWSG